MKNSTESQLLFGMTTYQRKLLEQFMKENKIKVQDFFAPENKKLRLKAFPDVSLPKNALLREILRYMRLCPGEEYNTEKAESLSWKRTPTVRQARFGVFINWMRQIKGFLPKKRGCQETWEKIEVFLHSEGLSISDTPIKRRHLTREEKEKMLALFLKGEKIGRISLITGRTSDTVRQIINRYQKSKDFLNEEAERKWKKKIK